MSAERLDYQYRSQEGQTLEDSAIIVRWWAMYYDRLGQPTAASDCRRAAGDIERIAAMAAAQKQEIA